MAMVGRLLGRLARLLGWLVLILVVALGLVLATLHTDWGRGLIRNEADAILDQTLLGGADIGRIEGSLLGRFTLRDLVVRDAAGRPAVRVAAVTVETELGQLLDQVIAVREIVIDGLVVEAHRDRDGVLNLATLVEPSPPSDEPATQVVRIGRISVTRSALSLTEADGSQERIDDLSLEARVAMNGADITAELSSLRGRWGRAPHDLDVAAAVTLAADTITATGVRLGLGSATVSVPLARYDLDDGSLLAVARVRAPADALAALAPDAGLVSDLDLSLWAARVHGAWPLVAGVALDTAGGRIDVHLATTPELPVAVVRVRGAGLDPARVVEGAVASDLALDLDAELRGAELDTLTAQADLRLRGLVQGTRVPGIQARVDVAQRRAQLAARFDVPDGDLAIDGVVRLAEAKPEPESEPGAESESESESGPEIIIDRAHLRGGFADLGRALATIPGLRLSGDVAGAADLDLRVSGPIDGLSVSGQIGGRALQVSDASIDTLAVELDLAGLPGRVRGQAAVAVDGVVQAGTRFGDISAEVRSQAPGQLDFALSSEGRGALVPAAVRGQLVQGRGGAVDVTLSEYHVNTGQLVWQGRGGQVHVGADGALDVRALSLASLAGRLDIAGAFAPGGSRGAVGLDLRDLDLAQLRQALVLLSGQTLDELGGIAGRASGKVQVGLDGRRIDAALGLDIDDLALTPDAPPVDISTKVALGRRALTVELRASGARVGAFSLSAGVTPPADPSDAAAWQRLDEGAITQGRIELAELSIPGLRAWAPEALADLSAGVIDGAVEIGPGARVVEARVSARGVTAIDLAEPIDLDTEIELREPAPAPAGEAEDGSEAPGLGPSGRGGPRERVLTVLTRVASGERGAAELRAEASVPAGLTDAAAWQGLDERALRRLTLSVSGVDVDYWAELGGASPELGARAALTVDVTEAAAETRVSAQLTVPAAARPGLPAVSAELNAAMTRADLSAGVEVALDRTPYLSAQATLAAGLDALLRAGAEPLLSADARAELSVRELPMALLGEAAQVPVELRGTLGLTGAVSGTPLAPEARVELRGDGVGVGDVELAGLQGRVEYGGERLLAALEGRQSDGGGRFGVDAKIDLAPAAPAPTSPPATSSEPAPAAPPQVDVRTRIDDLDLAIAAVFVPNLGLDGRLDADLRVRGPLDLPQLSGDLHLRDGLVRPGPPLHRIEHIDLRLQVEERRAVLRLGARAGQGKISAEGEAALADGLPQGLDLTLETNDLPLDFGATMTTLSSRTRVRGQARDQIWDIDTVIEQALVELPKESGRDLYVAEELEDVVYMDGRCTLPPPEAGEAGAAPAEAGEAGAAPDCGQRLSQRLALAERDRGPAVPPSLPPLHLRVRAPDSIQIRGAEGKVLLGADLDVDTRDGPLVITGAVAANSGVLDLIGRRYEVERAVASFDATPDAVPDPRLDVLLSHEFPTLTLFIQVQGTASKPELILRADPDIYEEGQLLAFVLGAEPGAAEAAGPGGSLEDRAKNQAVGVASSLLVGQVQSLFEDVLPVDVLKVELGDESTSAESLTVGKWLTDNLFLSYSHRFEAGVDENPGQVAIEYRFWKRWLLEAFYGVGGAPEAGLDLLWIKRF
ncbi:translocation/assembly module TamB domain-containing protein [Haliangium sp.]|uniref:translocation/assembly module TamB domain-containing protein n=1 Tax=Haliangium sp. TaxID=2663208 RepID=UPI003D0CE34B